VIEFENVVYGYSQDNTGKELLDKVSLNLGQGSFHFLTGPSGAGKTTFLKLCYGDLLPREGLVAVFGEKLSKASRDDLAQFRRRIGMVPQNCEFLDHLPLSENVLLPLLVSGGDVAAAEGNLLELLAWVGLEHLRDAFPPELSGGERQRAALARALVLSPDIILADEPTGNVDWDMSQRLLSLLVELNRLGKTVLIATHDLNLIRGAKSQVEARVLRIANHQVQLAGAAL